MNQPELIVLLQQGDEAAFRRLVNEYQDMVYNTVVSILQSAEAAEDVTQEVFIQVYRSVGGFKGEAKLSTWLYRIAVNKALDQEKKERRTTMRGFIQRLWGSAATAAEAIPDFHHPGIALEQKEHAALLFRSVKQLPEKQRIAFTLHKMEGLPHPEIAAIMGTTIAAVESLIGRAKTGLKKSLEAYFKNKQHE